MIQSFLTFDSMDGTFKCDHSSESCGAVCFVNFNPFCKFGKLINYGLNIIRSERGKRTTLLRDTLPISCYVTLSVSRHHTKLCHAVTVTGCHRVR